MRIAFFTETFLPKIDGIVVVLCRLLDHLAKRDHQSILFAPGGSVRSYAKTRVISVPGVPFPLYPELTLSSPFAWVKRPLERFQPDVVHLVNPAVLGFAGLRAARGVGVPVVAYYHTDVPGFAARWGFGFTQKPLWAYFRYIYNHADLTFVPSSYTKREIEAHDFERVKVLNHGVDAQLFSPHKRSSEWRWRLSDGNMEKPLLLYVGRVAKEKRIDWLLDIVRAYPDVRLAIVGDGPAREQLERDFLGTPTVFTGYLRGEELARAYASADIFIFPGANETFGNVVIEAMASGLPVVVPDCGGVLDFVRHGENGLWFDSENRASLVEITRNLLENPSLTTRLAQAGRATAESMNWDTINDALLDEYADLADNWRSDFPKMRAGTLFTRIPRLF
jgi:glycosyltransferase involved in cell wall biosynthesis